MPCASSRISWIATASSVPASWIAAAVPGAQPERQLLRLPEPRGECDQPLLGAVVEVPLDPLALGVGGADEPRARRDEAGGDGFPLGDRHREEQRREGSGGDEELDRERLAR